ncbi:LOW QUALITY PROTEIN: hypothetical protein ACHAWF_000612, partial [Thalassiosira exigua]
FCASHVDITSIHSPVPCPRTLTKSRLCRGAPMPQGGRRGSGSACLHLPRLHRVAVEGWEGRGEEEEEEEEAGGEAGGNPRSKVKHFLPPPSKRGDREGEGGGGGSPKDLAEDGRWYEVDRPSVIHRKAQVWLPGCMPGGYQCPCEPNCKKECSYSISISPRSPSEGEGRKSGKYLRHVNYHLLGHDVQCPPSDLFDAPTHPILGYDQSVPTMFVLDCVLRYLPTRTALLRSLAKRRRPSDQGNEEGKSDVFVAVVTYNPIRSDDRFKSQLSLEAMPTLSNQFNWFIQCGFDVERGCDMSHAYEWGPSQRKSVNVQCGVRCWTRWRSPCC